MSVSRQLAIHTFSKEAGLPLEMVDEILSFCFYDTITAVHLAVHRANMTEVVTRFTGAWISRANNPEMDDTDEHWAINLVRVDHDEDDEVQFQATNCGICGNYKECSNFDLIPLCITCSC
jgi:hypothetical protein